MNEISTSALAFLFDSCPMPAPSATFEPRATAELLPKAPVESWRDMAQRFGAYAQPGDFPSGWEFIDWQSPLSRCGDCNGSGWARGSRSRGLRTVSARVARRNRKRTEAREHCAACSGNGYRWHDARPQQTPRAAPEVAPLISELDFQKLRARRLLSERSRAVGAAWFSANAQAARPLLTPLWPLTSGGRWAYALYCSGDAPMARRQRQIIADVEARQLLAEAELEAKTALRMLGIAVPVAGVESTAANDVQRVSAVA